MSFRHKEMDSTQTEVKAMDDLRDKIEGLYSDVLAFPYSPFYLGWETNKVLKVHDVEIHRLCSPLVLEHGACVDSR